MSTRPSLSLFLFLACGAASALAHEGDPKATEPRRRHEVSGREGRDLALSVDTFSFAASGVQLRSWIPLRDLHWQASNANSCFGYASPSGREYAIIGLSNGTAFVEVTDPGAAELVAFVDGAFESLWRDIKVYQQHAYVVTEGAVGIQVVDLTQIDAGVVTLVNTITTGGGLPTHTVALDAQSGFLYRCGGDNNGMRFYSLANPASPVFVGSWPDRYVHEAQVVTYTSGPYAGRQIAFACSGFNGGFSQTGLDIVDVTNKSNPFLVKRFLYPNAGYSHQGWLSPDRKYFYLNDEKDEQNGTAPPSTTRIINVQNLSNPSLAGTFASGAGSIDHNLYTKGNLIYQANYTSGLRVFDATVPTAPVQIAWFDTYPEHDLTKFKSLWNNYPYLPSGIVLGSDIERGLFVWTVGAPTLSFSFTGATPETFDPAGESIAVQIAQSPAGSLVAGSAELHFDAGAGWTSVPLTAQGGSTFLAPFPAHPCGGDLAWYLSARATDGPSGGSTWTWPQGAPVLVARSTAALGQTLVHLDDLESGAPGWIAGVPNDTALRGQWQLADPDPTDAQDEFDHTPGTGINAFVTGPAGEPYTIGHDDVDGGTTTLWSPLYDLSGLANPVIRYWRWYSNHLGAAPLQEDVFVVEITNDDGGSWHTVEVVGPTGPGTTGGWVLHQFRVADVVAPTAEVRLRFIASDLQNPSNVEAAIDDLAVLDLDCPASGPTTYCTAKTNSQGCTPAIASSGSPSATSPAAFLITASQVINEKTGLLLYGYGQASTPFQGGTLCVAPPLVRTAPQSSGGSALPAADCSGTYAYDFNARIQSGADPALTVGASVAAQYWYRDPADPTGFATGLSDALWFTIAP